MITDPTYKNGSVTLTNGVEIQAQGKFEMFQSTLYPRQCGVPSEHFFIVKIEFKSMKKLSKKIYLKQVNLSINDRTLDFDTQVEEPKVFPTEKKFFDEKPTEKTNSYLFDKGNKSDCDILLYVENIGIKVEGHVDYVEVDEKGKIIGAEKKMTINPFNLDLPHG